MTNEEASIIIGNIPIPLVILGTNDKCYSIPEYQQAKAMAIEALEQQPCEDLINQRATTCRHRGHCEWVACDKCNHYESDALSQQPWEDCISRQSVKRKLQEHHDFFIHSYGGFSNMSQNDKSRVDEIINCIAMVVNEPSVTPKEKTGKWVETDLDIYECSECHEGQSVGFKENFCPNCGAKIVEPQESEDCRDCKKWGDCPCGKEGHESGTSQGYSIGGCKDFEPQESEE